MTDFDPHANLAEAQRIVDAVAELERTWEQFSHWRTRRDQLIAKYAAEGIPRRAIAAACRLSIPGVARIVDRQAFIDGTDTQPK